MSVLPKLPGSWRRPAAHMRDFLRRRPSPAGSPKPVVCGTSGIARGPAGRRSYFFFGLRGQKGCGLIIHQEQATRPR